MNKFQSYKFFKFSQIKPQKLPEIKTLSEQEIKNLKIETVPWKHGSGPGGQKVNTKASGGRAFCSFNGKKYTTESKIGRDTVNNQGVAKRKLIKKLNDVVNQERNLMILSEEKLMKNELMELKGVGYKFPEVLYELDGGMSKV